MYESETLFFYFFIFGSWFLVFGKFFAVCTLY